MTHPFAQTNIQLYGQLLELGYGEADLVLARASWEVATPLFATRFRSNGKPFLAHLAGTASILAWIRSNGTAIAAGLLHAAYQQGDFGDSRHGMNDARRRRIERAVGKDVEATIAAYTAFPWNSDAASCCVSGFASLTGPERALVTIRLANELEDHLDLGMLFSAKARQPARGSSYELSCIDLAGLLGHSELAHLLETSFAATRDSQVPAALKREETKSFDVNGSDGIIGRMLRRLFRRP